MLDLRISELFLQLVLQHCVCCLSIDADAKVEEVQLLEWSASNWKVNGLVPPYEESHLVKL